MNLPVNQWMIPWLNSSSLESSTTNKTESTKSTESTCCINLIHIINYLIDTFSLGNQDDLLIIGTIWRLDIIRVTWIAKSIDNIRIQFSNCYPFGTSRQEIQDRPEQQYSDDESYDHQLSSSSSSPSGNNSIRQRHQKSHSCPPGKKTKEGSPSFTLPCFTLESHSSQIMIAIKGFLMVQTHGMDHKQ